MGLVDFQVILDNPMKVYFAGQPVSGQVLVNVSQQPKKMKCLKVAMVGRGEVHWSESETRSVTVNGETRNETVTRDYRASESYLDQEAVVFHGQSLNPGTHLFPFTFLLPGSLPSSYESRIGHVRYFIKADIVRDWRWNHKTKQHVTVNGILDLNLFPSALQAGSSHNHKTLCCLCCRSGPISALIATNRTGFVPGEMIGFSAEVDNQSTREMSGSFLNLVEVVTYRTPQKNKTEQRVVAEIRRGRIGPGCQDMWEGVTMRVPSVPPTNLAGPCNIISVQYKLDFHVDPSGLSFDLVVSLPITVGTIPPTQYIPTLAPPPPHSTFYPPQKDPNHPIYPSQTSRPPASHLPSAPQAPDSQILSKEEQAPQPWQPSAPPDRFSMYPDLPPPSYAESVWGVSNVRRQEEDENTMGDFEFIPRYPTYNTNY